MNKADKLYAAYKLGYAGTKWQETYFAFLANVILDEEIKELRSPIIIDLFEKKYGIRLPTMVVNHVLSFGLSRGVIAGRNGIYRVDRQKLEEFRFKTNDFSEEFNKIVNAFSDYCTKTGQSVPARPDLENIVLDLIDDSDDYVLLKTSNGRNQNREYGFAWYSFLKDCAESSSDIVEFVATVCASNVLREAIVYTGTKAMDLSRLSVYLDTPMVFALLGMDEGYRIDSYKQLLEALHAAKCDIWVFDHNLAELRRILISAADWANDSRYNLADANNASRFFHDNRMSKEDCLEFIDSVKEQLELQGIYVKPAQYSFSEAAFQEDEHLLQGEIERLYKERNQTLLVEKERSILVDVRSIIMIYRLRRGHSHSQFNEVRHLMITTNRAVAKASAFYERKKNGTGSFPPAMTVDLFGAVLWIGSPHDGVSYHRKKLLADCFDYLQPTPETMQKFVNALNQARERGSMDDSRVLLLRSHALVTDALSKVGKGKNIEFDDRTMREIEEEFNAAAEKKYIDEHDKHEETRERLVESEKTVASLRGMVEDQQTELERTKNEAQAERERAIGFRKKSNLRFATISAWCIVGFAFFLPAMIGLAVLTIVEGRVMAISWRGVAVVVLCSLANGLASHLYSILRKWLEKTIGNWINLHDKELQRLLSISQTMLDPTPGT